MTPDTSPTDFEQVRRRRLAATLRCRLVRFGQSQMLVLDTAGATHRWGTSQRECRAGSARRCETHRAWTACRGRLRMPQAGRLTSAITEPGALYHHLRQTCARRPHVLGQPQGTRVRETCHV
ncbi:hypothetical protein AQJ11_37640 [Streptomyces corchorusii]|uniref:Uncharacterized protein n=1 Tax=Streptomyces corchorusii TaxID=1903 RepID=A0A117QAG6_STRCK|nr:hypothetical protein AQJ11_37640 [Streptomyces corchorusii]